MNWVDEESDNTVEQAEEQYVLCTEFGGLQSFMMKGRIFRKNINLILDSGSPITIISFDDGLNIFKMKWCCLFGRGHNLKHMWIKTIYQ